MHDPKVETIEGNATVTCDRCKLAMAEVRITYPMPVDWRRILCRSCWDATKDRDPMVMIRDGDGTV